MKNLVDIKYLEKNFNDLIIIDARNNFLSKGEGKKIYDENHILGSFHIDLHEDMVGTIKEHGGRDPFPDDIKIFVKKLEDFGITNDSNVVVYDDSYLYSARFWIMCKFIGLDNVKLLNANEFEMKNSSIKFTSEKTQPPKNKGKINLKINYNLLATIDDVRLAINNDNFLLLDSRDEQRYLGEVEMIDKESGHIPSAINYPFINVIENGKFKDISFFEKHFEKLKKEKNIIAYCGSGVSANINLIALDEIDIFAKLYVGSWSDYITYDDSIIEKGKNNFR